MNVIAICFFLFILFLSFFSIPDSIITEKNRENARPNTPPNMQNCPRQLAMQSCAVCLYVRCGSSNQRKEEGYAVNLLSEKFYISPIRSVILPRTVFRIYGKKEHRKR